MSHLACAEQQDHSLNSQQLTRFQEACRALPKARASFANSSGIFLGPDYHFDLARPARPSTAWRQSRAPPTP